MKRDDNSLSYVPLLSSMNISFYLDARMHFWNVELAYKVKLLWPVGGRINGVPL